MALSLSAYGAWIDLFFACLNSVYNQLLVNLLMPLLHAAYICDVVLTGLTLQPLESLMFHGLSSAAQSAYVQAGYRDGYQGLRDRTVAFGHSNGHEARRCYALGYGNGQTDYRNASIDEAESIAHAKLP